jgi:hypothetical protein
VRFGEALHVLEGVLGIGLGIVGADRREADALGHQHFGIPYEAVDNGFDVGAVIADEHDHRTLRARDSVERIGLAVGCRQAERWRRRAQIGRYSSCGHGSSLLVRHQRRHAFARMPGAVISASSGFMRPPSATRSCDVSPIQRAASSPVAPPRSTLAHFTSYPARVTGADVEVYVGWNRSGTCLAAPTVDRGGADGDSSSPDPPR